MALYRRQLVAVILASMVLPGSARAQPAAADDRRDWSRVDALTPGTGIVVMLKTGEQRIGAFRRATPDAVTIAVRGKGDRQQKEETLPSLTIEVVTTTADPLWNGALLGAGIGTGLATWDYFIDPSEPGNAVIFTVAIGLGAAIGAGIDALVKRRGKVLYASPRKTAGVAVAPILEKDQQGVLVSVRF